MTRPIAASPFANALNNGYTITSILSFILLWVATSLLAAENTQKRIGRITYWALVSIPLVYFLSQFPALFFNLFDSLIISNPTLFGIVLTLIFSLSKIAGGILFGIAFWTIAKNLPDNTVVKSYMIITRLWTRFVLYFKSSRFFSIPIRRSVSAIWITDNNNHWILFISDVNWHIFLGSICRTGF